MRIRTIKPEFWADELIASWPPITRLAYIALWNESDDEGRLRADLRYLQSRLFPYDSGNATGKVLEPIVNARKLLLYKVGRQTYGFLPKFNEHQRINKPSKSKLPPPPPSLTDAPTLFMEDSGSVPVGLPGGMEGNREQGEGNGKEGIASAKPPRPPDLIWDSVCQVFSIDPQTKSEKSRVGKIVKDLKAKGATPDDIRTRHERYKLEWPGAADTPEAILKHWDRFRNAKPDGENQSAPRFNQKDERGPSAAHRGRSEAIDVPNI